MRLVFSYARLGAGRHRLHVVAVQVALEVEVRQRLALANGQQRLQGRIRLDVVLVLQVLLLHVVVHTLGHLRAAHQGTVGLAQELAELIRHLGGALKDAQRAGRRTLGGGCAALALARILQLAVDTLLQLLHLTQHRRHRLAQGVQVASHGLQVLIQSGGGASGGGLSSRHHGGGRHHHRRSRRSGSLRGLHGLRGLGRLHNRGRHGGGRRSGRLLRNLGSSGLRRGRGGVHYTGD